MANQILAQNMSSPSPLGTSQIMLFISQMINTCIALGIYTYGIWKFATIQEVSEPTKQNTPGKKKVDKSTIREQVSTMIDKTNVTSSAWVIILIIYLVLLLGNTITGIAITYNAEQNINTDQQQQKIAGLQGSNTALFILIILMFFIMLGIATVVEKGDHEGNWFYNIAKYSVILLFVISLVLSGLSAAATYYAF
jgi:Na+/melibiose symporter-like transporter